MQRSHGRKKGGTFEELRKVTGALRPREACVGGTGEVGRGQAV